MFGKKSATEPVKPSAINVQTIPADFYGGANPVIKFKKVEKEIILDTKPTLTTAEKKLLDQSTAVGSDNSFHAANIFTNRKYAFLFLGGLFVLIAGGVSGYYFWQSKMQQQSPPPAAPQVEVPSSTIPEVIPTTTPEIVIPTTTETSPTSSAEAPIDFPSNLLGDSADLDKDGITDVAEELFNTDPSKPDTDEDGYTDGHEVFYLYNPAGKEPIRLIESSYIKEYKNPVFGYTLFYPTDWAVGAVDDTTRQVLFSTLTGENIEIRTFDLLPNQTFADWFSRWVPNDRSQDTVDFQTKFFEVGKSRTDSLVYYFYDTSHVYALIYHTTDSNIVNYKSVMVMVARSFKSPSFVPPEPGSPAATSAGAYPSEMPASLNPGS